VTVGRALALTPICALLAAVAASLLIETGASAVLVLALAGQAALAGAATTVAWRGR
jgi:hypothetical protein